MRASMSSSVLLCRDWLKGEIVEQRDAVRLGPYADPPRGCDVRVFDVDVRTSIEGDTHSGPGKRDAQRMPLVPGDRRIDVLDRGPAPSLRVVQRDVVLQCVRARHVILVAVLPSPHEPAGLVFLAG